MSKGADSNAVMYAVGEVCALYRVKIFRMQSRTFQVVGAAGRTRPMFVGQWTDDNGTVHYKGMADLLARPRISVFPATVSGKEGEVVLPTEPVRVAVPLWIECKSGKDKMSAEQEAFRHHVMNNGEYHIEIKDDVRPLMAWFEAHDIKQGAFQKR